MVGKSVKLSSKDTSPDETISQALVSKSVARNLKVCGNKGALPSRQSDGDLGEDLSDINHAEVAGYLNNTKEFILNKIAWELMNPEYQKGTRRKVTIGKRKDSAPSKKTSATTTESDAESENEKRLSLKINYDTLDKLFDDENSAKRVMKKNRTGTRITLMKMRVEEMKNDMEMRILNWKMKKMIPKIHMVHKQWLALLLCHLQIRPCLCKHSLWYKIREAEDTRQTSVSVLFYEEGRECGTCSLICISFSGLSLSSSRPFTTF